MLGNFTSGYWNGLGYASSSDEWVLVSDFANGSVDNVAINAF